MIDSTKVDIHWSLSRGFNRITAALRCVFSTVFPPDSWRQILLGKAVGAKLELYADSAFEGNTMKGSTSVRETFTVRQLSANNSVCPVLLCIMCIPSSLSKYVSCQRRLCHQHDSPLSWIALVKLVRVLLQMHYLVFGKNTVASTRSSWSGHP